MNKEFVKKMIKAQLLRYEAIKEILPEELKKRVNDFEKNAASFAKEIAVEIMQDRSGEVSKEANKGAKKVDVDFS
jgi:hypothetical protein